MYIIDKFYQQLNLKKKLKDNESLLFDFFINLLSLDIFSD